MALKLADRVVESSTSTGTGAFALSGAAIGYQTFASRLTNADTVYYTIQGKQTDGSLNGEWEVGIGTYASNTLTRTTVLESSNADALVVFSAGNKDVFIDLPSEKAVYLDTTNVTNSLGGMQLDTAATTSIGLGKFRWNTNTATASFGIVDGTDEVNIGEQMFAYVTNAESVAITRGQAVYLYQAQGNRATVKLASNLSDATSAKTLGLVAQDSIGANQTGFVITQGQLSKLATGSYTEGATLYLGDTPGTLTTTKPYAPNHLVYIGVVERANNGNGQVYVRPQNGYELDEIHDVQIISPTNGQTIVYDSATSLWKNSNSPRVLPRVLASTANSATPTLNTDNYDMMVITGQSVAITSFTTNLSGTPANGQRLWISITGTTSIAITWGASFESSNVTLPTTTSSTNRLDIGFVWNVATSKWRCVALA